MRTMMTEQTRATSEVSSILNSLERMAVTSPAWLEDEIFTVHARVYDVREGLRFGRYTGREAKDARERVLAAYARVYRVWSDMQKVP